MIFIILLASFIALLWAANHLVTGAAGVANYFGFPTLLIGLTLVALGASAPEISIAITAALRGKNELALGNAIGANIANIGLVLGITILLRPLTIRSTLIRREYPLLFLIMLFTYSLMLDGHLGVIDGCFLLVGCMLLIGYFVFLAQLTKHDAMRKEFKKSINIKRPMLSNYISLIIGLTILPLSSHFLVDSAAQLAYRLGLSDLVMGLTIISFGNVLPNLITSIVAAFKGYDDIAVGNVLGSNMFNLLIVMAFPSIINPSQFSNALLWRDIPVMFLITFILLMINFNYKNKMERWHGGLLLLIYCSYMIALVVNAVGQQHHGIKF